MVENHYDIVNRCTGKSGRMEDDMFTPPHISLAATLLFAIYLIGLCSLINSGRRLTGRS